MKALATTPAMASATAPATADGSATGDVHCRACWRALEPHAALRLPCGDALCAACLGATARAALASAVPSALPLRCCWAPVPAALLRGVLLPPERAFYAFRTAQRVAATRARVADDARQPLATPCDFCLASVRLATARDADRSLLPCGHVYCRACVATLQQTVGADGVLCCAELTATAAPMPAMTPRPVLQDTHTGEEEAAPPRRRLSARRTAGVAPPPAFQGKGKRKLQVAKPATAEDANVVDLLGDSDDDDEYEEKGANTAPHHDDQHAEVCVKCATRVDAATNRFRAACGHVFCRACLHERCLRALRNEEQGSIGFPVRCCHALVALELLRAVLSKRNFVKYEALVAKRGAAALPALPRGSRKRKVVATATADAVHTATGDANNKKKARTQQEDDTPAECVACMADVAATDRLTGPCGHVYCLECLGMMAKQSLEDRALVPIRCCSQEFPIEYVKRVLNRTQFTQYDRFLKEKDWRTSDLKSDKEYAAMVRAIDGKQCPECGIGVQKISGCDAMRCLRGHLFCFACEAAPCTCGRTRLENYGWVPPGTQPPNANAVPAAPRVQVGGIPLVFGAGGAGFAEAMAAANARAAGLLARALAQVRPANDVARVNAAAAAAAVAAARAATRPKAQRPKR